MKKDTALGQKRFLNCLRIQVCPGHYEDDRIHRIVDFCKTYGFDNVILMINQEEYNVGHITREEATPWVEMLKREKAALAEAGISVSLNHWMELGHLDAGRTLRAGENYVTQTDFDGRKNQLVVCPMDENWQHYFLDYYGWLIRELDPEIAWIEDDFRLHNHASPGNPPFVGCFCDRHMAAYNRVLGTDYSREEFVDRLFRKQPDKRVQAAFLDVCRSSLQDLADKLGRTIQAQGLGTKVGLMSSAHTMHSMEGRDWLGIHRALSQGGPHINRPWMPLYEERDSMKIYYQRFNLFPFVCRGYMPEDCHIFPELENGTFSTFAKDSETLRFQVEASIPLEIEGMTYDIFDFTANGPIDAFDYGPKVAGLMDYLTAVCGSGYSYHSLRGVTIPLDPRNAYNRPIRDNIFDMKPDEFFFGTVLQAHGISARCSQEKDLDGEVVVLAAGSVYNYTDRQLERLFDRNHVILEGKAAMLLIQRGLGRLIGAEDFREYAEKRDVQAYEQIEGDRLINGIPGYRATANAGNYVAIRYQEVPQVLGRVYDFYNKELGYGSVIAKGHLVIPYVITEFIIAQMNLYRGHILREYLEGLSKDLVLTDYPNVYAYYSVKEETVLILVNSTLNTLPVTRFKLTGKKVTGVREIDRDGVTREKAFTQDNDGFIRLEEPFGYISTKTLILETDAQ